MSFRHQAFDRHRSGDIVLAAVAPRLQARMQGSDLAVRWGGDEMTAQDVGEQIREDVAAAPLLIDGEAITVSVGVAVLLAAKQARRNRVVAMARPPAIQAADAAA